MIDLDVKKQESLPPVDVGSKYVVDASEDTLYELGQHLLLRFKQIKNFRERGDWEKDKAFCFEAYHMVPKRRPLPYPGAANLSCPLPRIGVDTVHANNMASLFANGNQIVIEPDLIQKDMEKTARKGADYMNYVMNHESNFYMTMDDADKKASMFGIGYLEPVYLKEEMWETVDVKTTQTQTVLDPQTQQPKTIEKTTTKREKKKKTVFDGTKIHSLPVESIYLSPFMKSIKQAVREDAVFKVFPVSYAELEDRAKTKDGRPALYKKSQVERLKSSAFESAAKNRLSDLDLARARQDGFYYDLICSQAMLDMAQAYLWYDVDGDGIKEECTVVFHPPTGTVIRVSLAKCRIVEIIPRPTDERFYGEGIPRIGQWLWDEWENFHNSRSNAGQWENTTFGFYRAGGRFNPQKITIQPGHFYPVDDPREVQFATPPRVGSSYFQEEQMLVNYFERLFAISENIQGVSSSRAQTATESINVSSKSSIRFSNPFNRMVTKVNELLNHVWELQRECAPEDKEFYLEGTGGARTFDKMQKYDYAHNLSFNVKVSPVYDQQLLRDSALLAYRIFTVNPLVQQHPEIMWELSQKTLDSLGINIKLPVPPQAKTLSPYEEHEMFKQGENPEPEVGEDYDHHYEVHMRQLNSQDLKNWDKDAVAKLILHIDKTKILKMTLEAAHLNQSGRYTEGQMPAQPGVTASRNPSQMFNNMRVAESGPSANQNTRNGAQGGTNAEAALNEITGTQVQ